MTADKQRNKAAIRQREYMEAQRKKMAEAQVAAGVTPIAPRTAWTAAELVTAIDERLSRFPADSIPVALVAFKDRATNLPGFQSAGEPLRSRRPAAGQPLDQRHGHAIVYVPAMRHFVVIHFDVEKRSATTRCVHETNVSNWEPAEVVAAKREKPAVA
jgi:hypothetical protein